jgi:pyruvate, water dikinase
MLYLSSLLELMPLCGLSANQPMLRVFLVSGRQHDIIVAIKQSSLNLEFLMSQNILWFSDIGMQDIHSVGGKNASLGEMINNLSSLGIKVPNGFATTAEAYFEFLHYNKLPERIKHILSGLDVENIMQLKQAGEKIRKLIGACNFSEVFITDITAAYQKLLTLSGHDITVAVRSSATAEDLPDASFAGQQETFLNVSGLDNILQNIKNVYASLYNDRAIAYRVHHGFEHELVGISAGVQRMVRSDCGASGVMFSIDTESGFSDVVFINASYGLGEMVVQGAVNPDEYYVYKTALSAGHSAILRRNLGSKLQKMIYADNSGHERVTQVNVSDAERYKFCLSENEITKLAKYAVIIANHYQRPMDIEWAKDGIDGELYILQARPETVKSRSNQQILERYRLEKPGKVLCEGRSIGQKIGSGRVRVLMGINEIGRVEPGDVLVTDMTDPDWEPIMKRAAAIVTNRGGRTCHAAIIARELGIPAVVGCSNATTKIADNSEVTVSCAEGDTGLIYEGKLPFVVEKTNLNEMPQLPFKIMLNVGNPDRAFDFQSLPNFGVGLARLEFIISQMIGIHPKALLEFNTLPSDLQATIARKITAYGDPIEYYVERLKEGIATIAAAFYPKMVIVRLSDFKSNEYRNLLGGEQYEPFEENPMLGFRGAGRYIDPSFQPCFELECKALKRVREDMGLTNVAVMIPFVRTLTEAKNVSDLLAKNGLIRGQNDLKVIMMCEIPANAILAEQFLEYFDGFSIGSNDLTQLTLGLDRDSAIIAQAFDERDPAVKSLIHLAIKACRKQGKYIGICGQGPSDYPDLAEWLVKEGIESISLNPDTVVDTWLYLAKHMG